MKKYLIYLFHNLTIKHYFYKDKNEENNAFLPRLIKTKKFFDMAKITK